MIRAILALSVFFSATLVANAQVPVNTSPPVISGTAQVGQSLTSTTGTWTGGPTSYSYQWSGNGAPIAGATSQTYVPVVGDIGHTLTVSVVAITAPSAPSASTSTSPVIAAAPVVPVNTSLPTISGTPQVGAMLIAGNGTWTNSPTSFIDQWQSAAPTPDILGFNQVGPITLGNGSYSIENAQQAWSLANPDTQTLSFQVRPGDQWSADVGRPGAPNRSEVDGFAQMFAPGTEVNISYNFDMTSATARTEGNGTGIVIGQAHNNDTQLGGATSSPFEIDLQPLDFMSIYVGNLTASPTPTGTVADFGTQTVNGTGIHYYQVYLDPNPVVRNHNYKMWIQLKYTGAGDNSGFLNVWRDGVQIVHATGQLGFGFNIYWKYGIYGTVTAATQIAQYQNMMVAARPLVLGTGPTYVPVASDIGNAVNLTVTASNASGAGLPASSAPTGAITAAVVAIPVNTAIPTITGTAQVGQTLTASAGAWSNNPTSFTYQWKRAGAVIAGAAASTYIPVTADLGNALTVSVTAINSGGSSSPATSAATTAIGCAATGGTLPRAANLLGILGISGHIGSYADNSQTVADAQYLGIGLWRDGLSGNSAATNAIYQGLVNSGISVIGLPWLPTDVTYAGNVAGAKAILAMGPTPQGTRALYAVEGPNEPSISTFTYPNGVNSSTSWSGVAQWQAGWYAAVHADPTLSAAGVLVSTPTLVGAEPDNWGLQFLTVPGGTLEAAGTKFADIYDYHLYPAFLGHIQTIDPTGGDAITSQLSADFVTTYAHGFAGSPLATVQAATRIMTEFGYNAPVDQPTTGKDMLNGLMNAWSEGLSAFCIYTLYPFGDGNEIYNGPGSPKTQATYIHNFTTPLKDTAANAKTFATGSLTYSLGGVPSTAKSILFQKSNGSYELVVWNNVTNWNISNGTPIPIASTNVTATFSSAATTLNIYDPTVQSTPKASSSGASTTVGLRDYPMIIEFIP